MVSDLEGVAKREMVHLGYGSFSLALLAGMSRFFH
jgi:hypothetical protein